MQFFLFFCEFEELVFFGLWIPDSGFRISVLVSGFCVLGLPPKLQVIEMHARVSGSILFPN